MTGWFRALERYAAHCLSLYVYPKIPLLLRPYSAQLERRLTVSEATIQVRDLPVAFAGTRLLLVTDIHTGPFVTEPVWRRVFRRLASLEPDAILLGGDFVTSNVEELDTVLAVLPELKAPLGTYGVLGNHDHYTGDAGRVIRELEAANVRLLQNRHATLERGGARLTLAGIDDWNMGHPDLDAALRGCGEGPVILLSHNPDVFFEAAGRGVSLVLSGHTHGGQVRLPGLPVLVRMSRYRLDQGRYRTDRAELVVTRGLGVTGLPLRWHCPPEAVLIRLEPAPVRLQ